MLFTKSAVSLAFSLSFLASAPPVWSSAALTTQFPTLPRMANPSTSVAGASLASGTKKYFAEALCTPYEKHIEHNAWLGALQYAEALASWQPNGSFQPAMDLYMGNDSRGQLGATLRANIDGAMRVHDLSTWPEKQRLFVFCNEPAVLAEIGRPCSYLGALAYWFDLNGTYYHNHIVVFCQRYYDSPSLNEALSRTDALPAERLLEMSAEKFEVNQGRVYFHESLHFADLTTPLNHSIDDSYGNESMKYGPFDVATEAKSENTAACLHIADAYTFAAAAILAQQRYKLADPPKPSDSVSRRSIALRASGLHHSFRHPTLPDPDTPDNHIINNAFGIGPGASVTQNSTKTSSGHQVIPGSSSFLKRVARPPRFFCTPENGCTKSMAATIATTISGPLICFLVAGLCVLSFIL